MQTEPPGPSPGKANQQVTVLIEALPPVLVIHLKRFWYDETAGGVVKTSKHVQISPELDIPLGTHVSFFPVPVRFLLGKAEKILNPIIVGLLCRSTRRHGAH
jgi:hypothetical protein